MNNNTGCSSNTDNSDNYSYLSKKKIRKTKVATKRKNHTRENKKINPREEEKILKYALKISKLEYKEKLNKQANGPEKKKMSICDIEPCTIIHATEEDFANPIPFFDSLWDKEHSTGIIKIIPPKGWREKNLRLFKQEYLRKFFENDRKLDTRKIVLHELHKAKVTLFLLLNFFFFSVILIIFNSRLHF